MLQIQQLRHYLSDTWHLQRRITHHWTNQVVTIEGVVTWQTAPRTEENYTDLYREHCVMRLENYTAKATQTYGYHFPSDSIAAVYFSDGRFFYTLDLTTSHCDIQHLCGDDTYDGIVDAISENQYQQIWQVRGPRKHYTSHTIFSRQQ